MTYTRGFVKTDKNPRTNHRAVVFLVELGFAEFGKRRLSFFRFVCFGVAALVLGLVAHSGGKRGGGEGNWFLMPSQP